MTNQYIDETIFEELIDETSVSKGIKFICDAPVGSGKSTAIKKFLTNWIIEELKGDLTERFKFIYIVPTVNIAEHFCNNFKITYQQEIDTVNESASYEIKPCVGEGAFKDFKQQMKDPIELSPLIVTTYSTASKCLGSMIEYFYRHKQQNKINECFLIIDEAHLLLQHSSLIETIRDFKHIGLLSATPGDIANFLVFKDFKYLRPTSNVKYDRTIYLHNSELKGEALLNQIASKVDEIMNGNSDLITLVKIEDKAFCNQLKDKLNYKYKVYLYNSDTKEVIIDEDGKFMIPNNDDNKDSFIVISTSCIQAGQSLKEDNLISLFIQTPLDVISNVQQFIGRNRQPKSQTHLYLHLSSKQNKVPLKYEHGNNRYKSKFNKMRAITWNHTSVDKWKDVLIKYGKVIDETKKEEAQSAKGEAQEEKELVIDGKEYTTKKALYKHYGIKSLRYIPEGYKVSERWTNKNGNKTRLYRLVSI